MKYFYGFDSDHRALMLVLEGKATPDELTEAYLRTCSVARQTKATRLICMCTELDVRHLKGAEVASLSGLVPALEEPAIQVIVAPDPLTYGMARMFQAYAAKTKRTIHVARDLEEACDFMGVRAPQFQPWTGATLAS